MFNLKIMLPIGIKLLILFNASLFSFSALSEENINQSLQEPEQKEQEPEQKELYKNLGETYWLNKLNSVRGPVGNFKTSAYFASYTGETLTQENEIDIFFKNNQQVLLSFRAPALDIGRRILVDGDSMWLSTPTSSRVLRIHPSQRLIGNSSNIDAVNYDFKNYSLDYEEQIKTTDNSSIKISLTAKDPKVSYQKIIFNMDLDTHRPIQSYHYAASGKLLKKIYYEKYHDSYMHTLRIIDPFHKDKSTLIVYGKYIIGKLPSAIFRKNNLLELTI